MIYKQFRNLAFSFNLQSQITLCSNGVAFNSCKAIYCDFRSDFHQFRNFHASRPTFYPSDGEDGILGTIKSTYNHLNKAVNKVMEVQYSSTYLDYKLGRPKIKEIPPFIYVYNNETGEVEKQLIPIHLRHYFRVEERINLNYDKHQFEKLLELPTSVVDEYIAQKCKGFHQFKDVVFNPDNGGISIPMQRTMAFTPKFRVVGHCVNCAIGVGIVAYAAFENYEKIQKVIAKGSEILDKPSSYMESEQSVDNLDKRTHKYEQENNF